MSMPSGATRVAAVIGSPIAHSLSPTIFNAAFEALGLDWVFVAFDVDAGGASAALGAMRTLRLEGLSVTMPHKTAMAHAVDRLTDDARALDAVNSVSRQGDELVGDNTDGDGFLHALQAETGFDPASGRCVVVGAGGAARAVVLAVARAGADDVCVVNRSQARGEAAAALAGVAGRVGDATDLAAADLVVNATPMGMGDDRSQPFEVDGLRPSAIVADLVYHPAETPLLTAARRRDLRAVNGVGMLVHQAAIQFERFTGQSAPVEVMEDAVRIQLALR